MSWGSPRSCCWVSPSRSASSGTSAAARARSWSRSWRRWRRWPRCGRVAFAPIPNVKATTDIVLLTGLRARRRARLRGRRGGRARVQPLPRSGAVDAVADGRLGRSPGCLAPRRARVGAHWGASASRSAAASRALVYGAMNLSLWVSTPATTPGRSWQYYLVDVVPVQRRARARQRRCSRSRSGRRWCGALPRFRTRFEVTWRPAPAAADARRRAARGDAVVLPASARPRSRRGGACATSSARRTPTAVSGRRRAALHPAPHGLGRDRPGGGRPQPARRRARRAQPVDYMRANVAQLRGTSASARARSSRSAGPGCRTRLGGRDLVGELRRARRSDGSFDGPGEHDGVRRPGAARRRPRAARPRRPPRRALPRRPAEHRRRLQLRRQGRPDGRRRHRRGAAGARGGGQRRLRRSSARRGLLRAQNPDGGYALQLRGREQRAVDRMVRDAGLQAHPGISASSRCGRRRGKRV